jgi:hypothetical protein
LERKRKGRSDGGRRSGGSGGRLSIKLHHCNIVLLLVLRALRVLRALCKESGEDLEFLRVLFLLRKCFDVVVWVLLVVIPSSSIGGLGLG